jgi:hypothetical protein
MSVSTTTNITVSIGDGIATSFSFPYYFQRAADLVVQVVDTTLNVTTDLVLGVDFSISGSFTPGMGYESGANILIPGSTLNLPTIVPVGFEVRIYREIPALQENSFPPESIYNPQVMEAALDRIVLMLQGLPAQVITTVINIISGGGGSVPSTTLSANAALSSPTRFYAVNTSGGAVTVTLPDASANDGTEFSVVNISFGGSNNVTVNPTGGDLINGAANDSLTPGETRRYFSNGTNWFILD